MNSENHSVPQMGGRDPKTIEEKAKNIRLKARYERPEVMDLHTGRTAADGGIHYDGPSSPGPNPAS